MLSFIGRRILIAIPTIILVSIFVFTLQKLLPGDPILVLAGEERDPAVIELLREKYHLNDPLPIQYLAWAGQALQGNLGRLAAHQRAGAGADQGQAARHPAARRHGDELRHPDRHPGRRDGRRAQGHGRGTTGRPPSRCGGSPSPTSSSASC